MSRRLDRMRSNPAGDWTIAYADWFGSSKA
jgi:hypothetical protein